MTGVKAARPRRRQWGKIAVIAAFAGAIAFGSYIGYLAWTNDTFPPKQLPFADYANVTSVEFNGSEYAVTISWLSSATLPLYVQITSSVSDAANSPVCDLNLRSVSQGQSIFLPFGVSGISNAPTSVNLWIAAQYGNGTEFTVQHTITNYTAFQGNIIPTEYACTEPSSAM